MNDELADALPRCQACGLGRLEPVGSDERPYWRCPLCGAVAVAS